MIILIEMYEEEILINAENYERIAIRSYVSGKQSTSRLIKDCCSQNIKPEM